jgi:hypothetical protein
LLIIQKEFAGFSETSERLDLLALDKHGNLVVIENKLDDSGRDVTWQALKYASYCSSLTKEQIRSIFQQYLDSQGQGQSAEEQISEFFDHSDYEEIELNPGLTQRVILIAANFRKEVTSTVLWLLNYKLRIQCFKVAPCSMGDQLFLNVEQIIPMQDAEEYVISMAAKTQDEVEVQATKERRHGIRPEFWSYLLGRMNKVSEQFQNISPSKDQWISTGAGIGGVMYSFVVSKKYARAELYLNRAQQENEFIFDRLFAQRETIEQVFGGELEWERMEGRQACRIKAETDGNVYDREQWPVMADFMVDAMLRLELAFRGPLAELTPAVRSGRVLA